MSCNPAIGGLGKGHLVREIDALDGIMGRAIDQAGIQFRMLNRSRGPAVQGPRAQADRTLYRQAIQQLLAEQPNLTIRQGEVAKLLIEKTRAQERICGIATSTKEQIFCKSVVLTTGTFLGGIIHIGERSFPAGRIGEKPSNALAQFLKERDFPLGRLKTGTPPAPAKKLYRFLPPRRTARRRPSRPLLLPERTHHRSSSSLPHYLEQRAHARHYRRTSQELADF